jgi:hypothetical protein
MSIRSQTPAVCGKTNSTADWPMFALLQPRIWTLVALSLSVIGCGSGEVRGKIAGKVTFQGEAVSEGIVAFQNNEMGIHMTANPEPDGRYEIVTAKGRGLPVGTYQVSVCPPPPPFPPIGSTVIPPPKPYPNIPQKYRDANTSGLTLTVKPGENVFDIVMQP